MKDGTADLTEGSVRQRLVQYALPLVVMNLMQSLYSMVDLLVSGYFIGNYGISGINNSSQITMLITQIIIGLAQGGNILIGQYFGAGKREQVKSAAQTLFMSFAVLSVILSAGVFALSGDLLRFLQAPAFNEALDYLRISSLGILFIAGYNSLVAAVRGVGNSKHPMKIIILSTCTNIVLDMVFVGGLQLGTAGAAAATVISQGLSFLLILIYVLQHREVFGICIGPMHFSGAAFGTMIRLGIPCAIQQSIAGLSWLTVTRFINVYGVAASAGAGVSAKIKEFCQLFISAVASATSTMVAQTLGAGKYDRAKEVLYTAIRITVGMACILIVIVELAAPVLVSFFVQDAETVGVAVLNLRIEIIGQLFYAFFLVYHSFAVGAGHTWFVMFSSFVNCIFVRVILVVILSRFLGLTGIFLACMIAPASSVPLGMIYVRTGCWRRRLSASDET